LIWFSDLVPLFQQDAYLSFLHPFIIGYLSQSKWGKSMECFQNPMDEKWLDYLHRLTPSFLIMSLENASENFVKEEINFSTRFISIGKFRFPLSITSLSVFHLAVQLLTSTIPVVLFNCFTVNFSTVMAYRLSTIPINITSMDAKIAKAWPDSYGKTTTFV